MCGAAIFNNLFDIWSTPVALPKSTVVKGRTIIFLEGGG